MKTITYNPETHVLVPREPTQAMCSAALAFDNNKPLNEWGMIVSNTYEETYSAMLAAAPQPEQVDVGSVAEHELQDTRCGCCGYMTYHREHMGCIRSSTPQPNRTAELEAALKVAREAIDALQNGLKWYQDAYPDSISEADHEEIAKVDAAIAKINEVLK